MRDTIVAVATALTSSAGVNIIRVSGESALSIANSIFTSRKIIDGHMTPNYMYLGKIHGENFSEKAFCVYYKSPFSYTGEDVIEVHCHGGKGITGAIVRLIREKGARPAEAGEFTKRAFLNGKLNLSEAEGILDMINASTESQMKNAYKLMSGELTKSVKECEELLIKTSALLEVKLDYPEEMEDDTMPEALLLLTQCEGICEKMIASSSQRKVLTEGIDIAIIGIPNAGKSSLLNALLGQERAIVSDEAGTTRDVVKESMEIDGIRFNFLDTAGIREQGVGKVERIGIERAKKAIESADVIINVIDISVPEGEEERKINALVDGKRVINVYNKSDTAHYARGSGIILSTKTGEGLEILMKELLVCADRDSIYSEGVIANDRQIYALEESLRQIKEANNNYGVLPTECILENIRSALFSLGKITGNNASDSVIDEVFSRFCVGK